MEDHDATSSDRFNGECGFSISLFFMVRLSKGLFRVWSLVWKKDSEESSCVDSWECWDLWSLKVWWSQVDQRCPVRPSLPIPAVAWQSYWEPARWCLCKFRTRKFTKMPRGINRNHVLTLSGSWCHFCVPLRSGVLFPPILHLLIRQLWLRLKKTAEKESLNQAIRIAGKDFSSTTARQPYTIGQTSQTPSVRSCLATCDLAQESIWSALQAFHTDRGQRSTEIVDWPNAVLVDRFFWSGADAFTDILKQQADWSEWSVTFAHCKQIITDLHIHRKHS